MIRIMIVEDQTVMRDALKNNLSIVEDFEIVATLGDSDVAVLFCDKIDVDLILMDVCTENDSSGLEAASVIKKKYPNIKIVMMTGIPEITFINKAKEAKADSFLYKSVKIEELIRCIRDTMTGISCYPSNPTRQLVHKNDHFTEREMEILRLLCSGMTRSELPEVLGISENSVKTHISNLLSKTGYTKISKLALYAVSSGLIYPKI